jgi:outer membrane protein assembly factor BamE (lipoprotein component of BamABCDE complex)
MKSAFILAIDLTFTLSGCKKETSVKSKTELICNGNWPAKSFTINPGIDVAKHY